MDLDPLRHASRTEQYAAGKAARSRLPRRRLAELELSSGRDPIRLLREQNQGRLRALVPLRRERMSESPFAFYRGAAAVMAADLASGPSSDHHIWVCGDAHLANFGVFASRDRDLLFELNDFDEAAVGPWEWDLKRLLASVTILGQELGLGPGQAHDATVRASLGYRTGLSRRVAMSTLERYFDRILADDVVDLTHGFSRKLGRQAAQVTDKARRNNSHRALTKLDVTEVNGRYRINDQPPVIMRIPELDTTVAQRLVDDYLATVGEDVATLLTSHRLHDWVLRVVGVGSVGTRCVVVLLTDADGVPLVLQLKEATSSVLERWTTPVPGHHGKRVVGGQRILQSSGDPFLGWFDDELGSFYVRQFRDMKGSVNLLTLDAQSLGMYGFTCGTALARAHAQSGTPAVILGHLGASVDVPQKVDHRLADFAAAYAEVNRADHALLLAATEDGWLGTAPTR